MFYHNGTILQDLLDGKDMDEYPIVQILVSMIQKYKHTVLFDQVKVELLN